MLRLRNLKFSPILAALLAFGLLSGCSSAQPPLATADPTGKNKEILIVYLSRTGNTKAVAEFIQKEIGGTLVPLELGMPYPDNYQATVQRVARENETGYLPPLKTRIADIEKYDVVFLGFPTWGMQLPPPVKSFLRQYSLKGKTVLPFNTNAGYGEGTSFQTVRELCPGCVVQDPFVTRGGIERDGVNLAIKDDRAKAVHAEVRKWLRKVKLLQ